MHEKEEEEKRHIRLGTEKFSHGGAMMDERAVKTEWEGSTATNYRRSEQAQSVREKFAQSA